LPTMGFKRKCPICGKHIRAFLAFGLPPRPNTKCPFCESLERHRSFWLFLSNRTNLFSGGLTVLHLAPETLIPGWLNELPHPMIGYLGNISRVHIDLDVMYYLATNRPEWSIILAGAEQDDEFTKAPAYQKPGTPPIFSII